MICDEKQAKKAWIALGQRVDLAPVDYTFDIEVQAMSGEKLPFIVRAARRLHRRPPYRRRRGTSTTSSGASSSAEGGSNQEGRPSKMGQIMGWACQSLKPQILQVRWEGKIMLTMAMTTNVSMLKLKLWN
jgi:hypothetical protein